MDTIRALLGDDLKAIDRLIMDQLTTDVPLIDQVTHYIIGGGGKRLRPLLVLLASRACGYGGNKHIDTAAIIEFIHTATLLHDDVVDDSNLRRGKDTANTVWGNQASILVGDFLYSRAFQMMVGIGSLRVMAILANATNTIAEGEVLQLINIHDPNTTQDRYLQVIYRKTAKLFEAGAQIAAVLADQTPQIEMALSNYGRHLGTAFQLKDDILDYSADPEEMGKNMGDDLAEGKPTLPLIHAMEMGSKAESQQIRVAIERGGLDSKDIVIQAIESTGALEYTARLAQSEAEQALAAVTDLPESEYKTALCQLAEFSVARTH